MRTHGKDGVAPLHELPPSMQLLEEVVPILETIGRNRNKLQNGVQTPQGWIACGKAGRAK